MEKHKISTLILSCLFMAVSGPAWAQWYEGPSGGTGGHAFDFWQETSGASDIRRIEIWFDKKNSGDIYCLKVIYRSARIVPTLARPSAPAIVGAIKMRRRGGTTD